MPKAKAMKKKTYGAKPKATKKVKAPAPAKKAPPPKKARARVVTSAREPRATDALSLSPRATAVESLRMQSLTVADPCHTYSAPPRASDEADEVAVQLVIVELLTLAEPLL